MATYVFSDVRTVTVPPSSAPLTASRRPRTTASSAWGTSIDRGPDPVGVMRTVRSLPGACALMGNHEDLMLSCLDEADDFVSAMNWAINGGTTTSEGLAALPEDELEELVEWVGGLPRWACAEVGERLYLLVHAGVNLSAAVPPAWDEAAARAYLAAQDGEDLTWIRDEFWGASRGLSGTGSGPVVVSAGHTPTPYLERMTSRLDRSPVGPDGLARMVRVGGDRWDVDCGAAGGAGVRAGPRAQAR